jgi:fructokinase
MRIGIDLGGTKTEIIALADDGRERWRRRVPTPRDDYAATLATIAALVAEADGKVGAGGTAPHVGIGIPGAESLATGLIKNANSTWLIGRPLRADLEVALGRPVRLANDANCFALSEAVDGAGVGGGIVANGKVIAGINAIAGEWGHNYLPPDPLPEEGGGTGSPRCGSALGRPGGGNAVAEPVCYCGRKGCIETYLSGPALARDHRLHGGDELDAERIASAAAAGDADCEATLARYEARLAKALASVINLLDPDVIVLGGGLSNIDRLYTNVPRLWGAHVFSDVVCTRLLKHHHGDSSGVRGAAWL